MICVYIRMLFKNSVIMPLLYIQLYVLLAYYRHMLYIMHTMYTADTFMVSRDLQNISILIVLRTAKKTGYVLTV